jgi:hypothetical protein
MADGLRLNLIQKCHKRIEAGQTTTLTNILEQMLMHKRHPSLSTHINTLGPAEWNITGDKIMMKNRMLSLAFKLVAFYLAKLNDSPEDWHLATVRGHTKIHMFFPLYLTDLVILETKGIVTASQLFETHLSGRIDKQSQLSYSPTLLHIQCSNIKYDSLPELCFSKLSTINIEAHGPISRHYHLDINLSWRYHLKCREILDGSIGVAPARRLGSGME